jgi:hypothetical protein
MKILFELEDRIADQLSAIAAERGMSRSALLRDSLYTLVWRERHGKPLQMLQAPAILGKKARELHGADSDYRALKKSPGNYQIVRVNQYGLIEADDSV